MSISHEQGYALAANSSSKICFASIGMRLCVPFRFADAGFQLALAICCVGVIAPTGNSTISGEVLACPVGSGSHDGEDSDGHALGTLSFSAQMISGCEAIDDEGARAESGAFPENEPPVSGEVEAGLTFTGADHCGT